MIKQEEKRSILKSIVNTAGKASKAVVGGVKKVGGVLDPNKTSRENKKAIESAFKKQAEKKADKAFMSDPGMSQYKRADGTFPEYSSEEADSFPFIKSKYKNFRSDYDKKYVEAQARIRRNATSGGKNVSMPNIKKTFE